MKYLGETLDIHAGGIDHIPIHHTNEIAQSEGATGKQFAKLWLHGNFLTVNGEKIAKSLGNGYTLSDLGEKGFSALDFRLFTLQSHYRTQADFTFAALEAAKQRLCWLRSIADLVHQPIDSSPPRTGKYNSLASEIVACLEDDLNTPEALAKLHGLGEVLSTGVNSEDLGEFKELLATLDSLFGLSLERYSKDISDEQKALIAERLAAKQARDYERADKLRDKLSNEGIILKDTESYSLWSRA